MPKLCETKPYYENRSKREVIVAFSEKKSFDAYRMWCRKERIEEIYSVAAIKRYALLPKNFYRYSTLQQRIAITKHLVKKGELLSAETGRKIKKRKEPIMVNYPPHKQV